ncbi:MAG: molybdopterin-guanine dinucleotide biosynthesis protein B [Desulforhopalus sp.]|nr:molybdopterin-guanine dinucleotide biosynthesis protein B [Desulforhopalus sp.]
MASIITFIGWHDSGKTTLATQVVTELINLGYRIAVIKSTSDEGIQFDAPGTDTYKHKLAGAESVMLVAPDQMVLQTRNCDLSLRTLAHRYFPDVDLVVGEGFKTARRVPKIEVFKDLDQKLREEVHGVVAVATDLADVAGENVFRLDAARDIALFIEKRYLRRKGRNEITTLLVNGEKIPLKDFVQEALASTIHGFIKTLKLNQDMREIELRIKIEE